MHSIRQCQGARICPDEPCISYPSEEIRQTTQQVLMQAYHLNSPEIFMVPPEKQKPAVSVGAALDDSQLNQDENHKRTLLHCRHSEPVQIVERLVDGCSTQRQVFLVARLVTYSSSTLSNPCAATCNTRSIPCPYTGCPGRFSSTLMDFVDGWSGLRPSAALPTSISLSTR
jgi:hypothetical protein